MSVRSFTVFQDTLDPTDPPTPPTDTSPTSLPALPPIEKENLHPVTGQRAGPAPGSDAKKRKSTALATKVLVVPSSKKHRELKASQKKARKPLASTTRSTSSDARKPASKPSRSRKPSPLPPVAEEHVPHRHPPRLSISQPDIDARCYELTVSPLADVSEAYDASRTDSQESDAHTDTDQSGQPVIRDRVSPTMADSPAHPDDTSSQTNGFSTPERKRIYSAFTFSSPSPTSERFKQTQSSPSRSNSPVANVE